MDLKRLFEGFLSLFIPLITFFAIKLILGSIVKQEQLKFFNFLKNGVLVALLYSKVYFLYLRLIFSKDRGYFEITFPFNTHKIASLRNSLITSSFVFNLKKRF
ncbi:hypothetical protein JM68_07070 [Helicobacter pylori]|nr:hypothetical protein JM68_07070 [Helicobacter pylori]